LRSAIEVGRIAQITHRGEAGQQRHARVVGGADGVVGDIPAELVGVAGRAGLAGQVGVAVDQARQASLASQTDDRGASRRLTAGADLRNALAIDDHRRLPQQLAGLRIEQLAALNSNEGRRADAQVANTRGRIVVKAG
jgi:hypothetical protein